MKPYIVVIGSTNTDMVVKTDHLPVPGETVLGGRFFLHPGGKGANQAVSIARLGGEVFFITKIGEDHFGRQSLKLFQDEKMRTDFVITDKENPSGIALISVDKNGENCIVVASGANANLLPADIDGARKLIADSAVLLMQLEIPLNTIQYAAEIAFHSGVKFILNPAPGAELTDDLLKMVSIITPNRTEAELITGVKVDGIESAKKSADVLVKRGVKTVIITMGAKGALILHEGRYLHVSAPSVIVNDTTGAGDIFNGSLAVALADNYSVWEATRFATRAAAISVTRLGAQSSAPYAHEIV
jgi:ribokinase